eukprot:6578003-Pyramimonas_sp.AAC.1
MTNETLIRRLTFGVVTTETRRYPQRQVGPVQGSESLNDYTETIRRLYGDYTETIRRLYGDCGLTMWVDSTGSVVCRPGLWRGRLGLGVFGALRTGGLVGGGLRFGVRRRRRRPKDGLGHED